MIKTLPSFPSHHTLLHLSNDYDAPGFMYYTNSGKTQKIYTSLAGPNRFRNEETV